MSGNESKQALRRRMKEAREALSAEERADRSRRICRHIVGRLEALGLGDGGAVLAYAAFGGEADVADALAWCWRRGVQVALPAAAPQSHRLELRLVRGWGDVAPGAYGIAEPLPACEPLPDAALACIIVPGVAFDRHGGRLGYGGGYYDRLLERLAAANVSPYLLAAAYELQLVEEVPTEPHDRPMHAIATEDGIYPQKS
ncbi:MAG: 5-formyltetrahydrofolate cyclo-ligase [Paenibacillaceae bacterium]|nr:5-formyltetrahydrofolate cyclo-ligase [Paenibacillaceae bacterium]